MSNPQPTPGMMSAADEIVREFEKADCVLFDTPAIRTSAVTQLAAIIAREMAEELAELLECCRGLLLPAEDANDGELNYGMYGQQIDKARALLARHERID